MASFHLNPRDERFSDYVELIFAVAQGAFLVVSAQRAHALSGKGIYEPSNAEMSRGCPAGA